MPADLPALTQLTEDVVAAMHVAEQREHRRHASRTRRRFGLLTTLVALLVPSGLALHTASAPSAPLPDQGHAYDFATAAGACTAGAVVLAAAATRATPAPCAAPATRFGARPATR
ncbi:hypothetical protein DSM104299_03014 [Baekduia alba]|uniref:hypothetical protein n=1 Tax=Baekduia alba TaxID=2997333 RepID=UPI00233F96BE|nr:hypothetical protein [Baekduia alba]WCB94282.1 hypothetical protein DSM104299_03014 [Baekduia alba]